MFVGRQIEGIWHTGVVAYGREYFFGGGGIQSCEPVSFFFLMNAYEYSLKLRMVGLMACVI